MKIFVKKLQGGECQIEVEGDLLVQDLKVKLENQLGVSTSSQTLVYLGKTLTDESSLSNAGLRDGCKLHLITRRVDPLRSATASDANTNARSQTSSGDNEAEEVFVLLSNILEKHLTPQQSERVLLEFRKNCKQMIDNMNLEDVQRFVDSDFKEF